MMNSLMSCWRISAFSFTVNILNLVFMMLSQLHRSAGFLAHEAFGHGVEADMIVKERARAAHYLGRMVASPLVSMIDDPSLEGLNGFYFFDDEGAPCLPDGDHRERLFAQSSDRSAFCIGLEFADEVPTDVGRVLSAKSIVGCPIRISALENHRSMR